VWDYYQRSLQQMRDYGARIIRLDAFAYLHKEVGSRNFFNEPGTWEYLDRLKEIADGLDLTLLPEIHSRYDEGIHHKLAANGYACYDFFFPGLVIHALETGCSDHLVGWIGEILRSELVTVNMLGCHDGIPLLDLKGLLSDDQIDQMIDVILDRGGLIKDLHGPDGTKISYYQVNATFFSALGEDPDKLLLARAIQLFMPGLPQVWYLDLLAGTNDHEAARRNGHKEINRTNLTASQVRSRLEDPLVERQLALLAFRNTFPAFGSGSRLAVGDPGPGRLDLTWSRGAHRASLHADLATLEVEITHTTGGQERRLAW
jgi:sucrose phosphorylase